MSAPESRPIDRHGTGRPAVEVFVPSETQTAKRPRLCRYGGTREVEGGSRRRGNRRRSFVVRTPQVPAS
jgi:hypothetical protein